MECEHTICLDHDNAGKLALWAAEIQRWAEQTWILCREDK